MKSKYIIEIETKESDFCKIDLKEVIEDGFENVGNHTLKNLKITEQERGY